MRNIILKIALSALIIFTFFGCPEKELPYRLVVLIYNATSDTLTWIDGTNNLPISVPFHKFTLNPMDTIPGLKSRYGPMPLMNEPSNLVESFFQQWPAPLDTVIILRHDTLVALWKYPNYSGPVSEHNFFNYNAWNSWKISSSEGRILFTIYHEDLTLKQKW